MRPLELLFPIDFTELDFRAIPFVAQLVDALHAHLTLMHVHGDGDDAALAAERLTSFFAEADRYPNSERILARGALVDRVVRQCATAPVDLLLLPASEGVWLPRPGHSSLRLQLLEATRLPVWTMGPNANVTRLHLPTKNVACWIDLKAKSHPQLPFAIEYAESLGAQLHLLSALPELTIPVLYDEKIPLHPETAADLLRAEAQQGLTRSAKVAVAEADTRKSRHRLVQQCNADVIFVPQAERPLFDWFGARPSWFHETACPVVMVPKEPRQRSWSLSKRPNEAAALLRAS
ncbi:MAG: universal stress protein [Archangium sp.]|nr:universal stress protein [Archangium sp.]